MDLVTELIHKISTNVLVQGLSLPAPHCTPMSMSTVPTLFRKTISPPPKSYPPLLTPAHLFTALSPITTVNATKPKTDPSDTKPPTLTTRCKTKSINLL